MTSKIAIINRIEKETDKAILVSADGMTWIPKSQIINIFNDERLPAPAIEIPTWLWIEKKSHLYITTTIEKIMDYLK